MNTCCFNCKHLEKIRDFECKLHGVCLYESTSKIVSCTDFEEET